MNLCPVWCWPLYIGSCWSGPPSLSFIFFMNFFSHDIAFTIASACKIHVAHTHTRALDKQTYCHTDRQAGRKRHCQRQTDRQKDRQADRGEDREGKAGTFGHSP